MGSDMRLSEYQSHCRLCDVGRHYFCRTELVRWVIHVRSSHGRAPVACPRCWSASCRGPEWEFLLKGASGGNVFFPFVFLSFSLEQEKYKALTSCLIITQLPIIILSSPRLLDSHYFLLFCITSVLESTMHVFEKEKVDGKQNVRFYWIVM